MYTSGAREISSAQMGFPTYVNVAMMTMHDDDINQLSAKMIAGKCEEDWCCL